MVTMTLDFTARLTVLIAVQQLQRPDGTLRADALARISEITGVVLPPETVSPPEAGTGITAALRWLGLAPVEVSRV